MKLIYKFTLYINIINLNHLFPLPHLLQHTLSLLQSFFAIQQALPIYLGSILHFQRLDPFSKKYYRFQETLVPLPLLPHRLFQFLTSVKAIIKGRVGDLVVQVDYFTAQEEFLHVPLLPLLQLLSRFPISHSKQLLPVQLTSMCELKVQAVDTPHHFLLPLPLLLLSESLPFQMPSLPVLAVQRALIAILL